MANPIKPVANWTERLWRTNNDAATITAGMFGYTEPE